MKCRSDKHVDKENLFLTEIERSKLKVHELEMEEAEFIIFK